MKIELSIETIATLLTWYRQMELAMSKGELAEPEKRFMAAAKEFMLETSKAETPEDHKELISLMKTLLTEMG